MAWRQRPAGETQDCANRGIIDTEAKFVRLTEVRDDGFVAFDFAIGEPEIYVEMLLPQAAFEAFCAQQQAIRLDAAAPAASGDDFAWRLADAARAAAGEAAAPAQSSPQHSSHPSH